MDKDIARSAQSFKSPFKMHFFKGMLCECFCCYPSKKGRKWEENAFSPFGFKIAITLASQTLQQHIC